MEELRIDITNNKIMTKEEIFEGIKKDVLKYRADNKVIKMMPGNDVPSVIDVERLCSQPVEGLLYDLDLDEASLATLYKDKPLMYANMMAINTVIRHLMKKIN